MARKFLREITLVHGSVTGLVFDTIAATDIPSTTGTVPAGGTTNQALLKVSAADYDTAWTTLTFSGGDVTGSFPTLSIGNDTVTYSKMQDVSAASRLIGRGSASGSGNPEEIAIGSGLTMDGTTLKASAGSVGGGPYIVVKSATETVTNSNALQSDDELIVPIGASETWIVEWTLFVTGLATADFQCAINVPSGATGYVGIIGIITTMGSGGTSGDVSMSAKSDLTDTGNFAVACSSGSQALPVLLRASVVNSTNSGNITLRWAQFSAQPVTGTSVLAGSYLLAYRKS